MTRSNSTRLTVVVGVVAGVSTLAIALLLLSGCTVLAGKKPDLQAAIANLTEYQAEQLKYVNYKDQYEEDQMRFVQLRRDRIATDEDWAAFDRIQQRVASVSRELATMREQWRETNVKPVGWDAAIQTLFGEVYGLAQLVERVAKGGG